MRLEEPVTVLHTLFRGRGGLPKDASLQDGGPFKPAIKGVSTFKIVAHRQERASNI